MGSPTDDGYWDTRYAEPSCHVHGDGDMVWDTEEAEWICLECEYDDEWKQVEKYG